MSINVCIISSSPKGEKSISFKISKIICERLESKITPVNLNSINLQSCQGCLKCMSEGKCIINDDVERIVGIMKESDLIIFATPVYFFNVYSKLKILIERIVVWSYRELIGKKSIIVCSADGEGTKETIRYLNEFRFFSGILSLGELSCYTIEFFNRRKEKSKINIKINKLVNNIKNKIYDKTHKLTLTEYISFNKRKRILSMAKNLYKNEYLYWKQSGLLNARYFKAQNILYKQSLIKYLFSQLYVVFKVKKIKKEE